MDPLSMEKAMIKNMVEKTGKPIDEWLEIVIDKEFNKYSEIVSFLKIEYSKGSKEKSKEDQNIIKILMGDEVAPRKDFITEKALEVENLDI